MSDDRKTKNNPLKLVKNQAGKPKPSPQKEPVTNVFITDERFKRAMDLINQDMDRALGMGQSAAASFQLLLGYLIESKLIDQEKFGEYVKRKVQEEEEKGAAS